MYFESHKPIRCEIDIFHTFTRPLRFVHCHSRSHEHGTARRTDPSQANEILECVVGRQISRGMRLHYTLYRFDWKKNVVHAVCFMDLDVWWMHNGECDKSTLLALAHTLFILNNWPIRNTSQCRIVTWASKRRRAIFASDSSRFEFDGFH